MCTLSSDIECYGGARVSAGDTAKPTRVPERGELADRPAAATEEAACVPGALEVIPTRALSTGDAQIGCENWY